MTINIAEKIGVVVIGRNEGQRLVVCLQSLKKTVAAVVYVDSGSTDDSVHNAKQLGVDVLNLDLSRPFTAARARNEGFRKLVELHPQLQYVQFVDGDCEVVSSWIPAAYSFLESHADVVIVCGRRRERYPESTIYNHQCDIEWNTPVGEAKACGGDCLVRRTAFEAVQGFRDSLIAGEEPELCLRLRAEGWKIWRIDAEMTLHDAAITRFSQWWKRSVRAGHAFAEGAYLHGKSPERHWVKETIRALVWGLLIPLSVIGLAFICVGYSLLLASVYVVQYLRMVRKYSTIRDKWQYALLMLLSKFAEACGLLKFASNVVLKRRGGLIEYK